MSVTRRGFLKVAGLAAGLLALPVGPVDEVLMVPSLVPETAGLVATDLKALTWEVTRAVRRHLERERHRLIPSIGNEHPRIGEAFTLLGDRPAQALMQHSVQSDGGRWLHARDLDLMGVTLGDALVRAKAEACALLPLPEMLDAESGAVCRDLRTGVVVRGLQDYSVMDDQVFTRFDVLAGRLA